jgi:hypothetical protein
MTNEIASVLREIGLSDERTNPCETPMNLMDGLTHGLLRIASALKMLGLADAATPLGAIEALCVELKDSSTRLADSNNRIAQALDNIAAAIQERG